MRNIFYYTFFFIVILSSCKQGSSFAFRGLPATEWHELNDTSGTFHLTIQYNADSSSQNFDWSPVRHKMDSLDMPGVVLFRKIQEPTMIEDVQQDCLHEKDPQGFDKLIKSVCQKAGWTDTISR